MVEIVYIPVRGTKSEGPQKAQRREEEGRNKKYKGKINKVKKEEGRKPKKRGPLQEAPFFLNIFLSFFS